jgi:NAD+ diphosphatase
MKKIFTPQLQSPPPSTLPALWFIFKDEEILLQTQGAQSTIPQCIDIKTLAIEYSQPLFLGFYDGLHCFAAELTETNQTPLPENFSFTFLPQSFETLQDDDLLAIATRAKQMLHWNNSTQFCGHCGKQTILSTSEPGKECPTCHTIFYPKISPVVLILLTRGNEILLARSPHFAKSFYSILAGFVEPGETAEEAAARETLEEVGIIIKNIRYFSSQPWPFPSNLMLGFTAEYASGELKPDPKEIEDAQWFNVNHLPQLPKPFSLSRKMIDTFVDLKQRSVR